MLSLSLIEQGSIDIQYFKKDEILSTGSIAIFNPNIVHKAIKTDNISKGYWVIYFDMLWCTKIQDKLFDIKSFVNINQYIIKNKELYKVFLSICKNAYTKDGDINIEENLKEFIKKIFILYCDPIVAEQDDMIVPKIKKYIIDHINEDMTIDTLSKHFNYSSNHIIKLFKQFYGITPHAFILNEKINHAKSLMNKNSEQNLLSISVQSGFYDQSHFCKNFKKVFGISPNQSFVKLS